MSKAFLKHANCLYVTRNSKRNRRKDEDDDGDEVEVEDEADDEADDEDEDEAAHPKHKHKEQNEMTMSSQPLSHESGNYMQQMKHALRHAAHSAQRSKLKCQGKTTAQNPKPKACKEQRKKHYHGSHKTESFLTNCHLDIIMIICWRQQRLIFASLSHPACPPCCTQRLPAGDVSSFNSDCNSDYNFAWQ
ncbi:hypothetical protein ACLKA7_008809 [Drosophila subpalustris]